MIGPCRSWQDFTRREHIELHRWPVALPAENGSIRHTTIDELAGEIAIASEPLLGYESWMVRYVDNWLARIAEMWPMDAAYCLAAIGPDLDEISRLQTSTGRCVVDELPALQSWTENFNNSHPPAQQAVRVR